MKGKAQETGRMAVHASGFGRGKNRKRCPGALKAAMRAILKKVPVNESERELQEAAKRWFHNKRVSEKSPPKRIGRTNRVKGKK